MHGNVRRATVRTGTGRPFRSAQELTRVRGIAEIRLRDIVRQGLACVGSQ